MTSTATRTAAVIGVGLLAAVPLVVVSLSPWGDVGGVLILATLPVLAVATAGTRGMLQASAAAVAVTAVAVLLSATGPFLPWLGTALVVLLALGASPLVSTGRHSTGALLVVLAAYLMASPDSASALFPGLSPLGIAGVLAALVAASTAWVTGVLSLALRRVRLPRSEVPAPTLPYTVLLAALAGLFTWVSLMWFAGTNAWWSVLTVAVVLQPTGARMRTKLLARAGGTLLGGLIALGLALWLPTPATAVVGAIAALATLVIKLMAAPYWLYATVLTVTIVFTTFSPQNAVTGDILRVGITLGTALVSAVAAVIAARLFRMRAST